MSVYKIDEQLDNRINHFGVILDDKISINFQNRNISINLADIVKILFLKRRKLHWNVFFIFISSFFFIVLFSVNLVLTFQLIILIIGLITLIMSLVFREYQHKFVLIKKYDFIEMVIKKHLISDVENLVIKFNKTPSKLSSVNRYGVLV